jgi:hypothetical protein
MSFSYLTPFSVQWRALGSVPMVAKENFIVHQSVPMNKSIKQQVNVKKNEDLL